MSLLHTITSFHSSGQAAVRQGRRRVEPALVVVLAITVVALVFFDRPLAVGDGLAYLIWLDSIALDGDLDLSNQAVKFAHANTYHIYLNEHTGRWASAFPFGVALLLTPFYRLGGALDRLPAFRVNDAHFVGIQGVPFAYTLCAMIGINLYALLAVGLAYRVARRFAGPWAAAAAALAVFLGTPILFYSSVDPINSHIAGGFATALFLWLWLRAREGAASCHCEGPAPCHCEESATKQSPPSSPGAPPTVSGDCFVAKSAPRNDKANGPRNDRKWEEALPWLWVGLAGGLVALCRWQVALLLLPVSIELLLRRRWREIVAVGLGFSLLAWLIPYSWWQMYGQALLLPSMQGDQNIALIGPVHTWRVLFSPLAGLFPWSPVAGLALAGLWPLARRDWSLAAIAAVMFLLQALVCGMVTDWWAGVGFGMRRLAELYPLYVLLLAALLQAASARRWLAVPTWTLAAVLAAYGVALVLARLNFTWTNPWGLARDTPIKELTYTFSREHWPVMWPVIKDHVGPWAWRKPGP